MLSLTFLTGLTTLLSVTDGAPTPAPVDYFGPILSTGLVGVILLMVILRVKIMPTYVYEEARAEWARERANKDADIAELKATLRDANDVYTKQVIPTLTRVLDAERELVDLRRNERQTAGRGPDAS